MGECAKQPAQIKMISRGTVLLCSLCLFAVNDQSRLNMLFLKIYKVHKCWVYSEQSNTTHSDDITNANNKKQDNNNNLTT